MAKKLICVRFLANCLASITECCSTFPGFRNCDGSGLTGQKDFKNIEISGKIEGNHLPCCCKKQEGFAVTSIQVSQRGLGTGAGQSSTF